MSYETLLTVTPTLSTVYSSSVAAGFDTVCLLSISGTTLGNKYGDMVCKLTINTDPDSTGNALSASPGSPSTSINMTLSSPSVLTTGQLYPVTIATSTYKANVSATITLTFPGRELSNTSISLSANSTTTVLDPTLTTILDNFFFLTGSPDTRQQIRTTGGNARIQAYMG
jgi:hypothetical protein